MLPLLRSRASRTMSGMFVLVAMPAFTSAQSPSPRPAAEPPPPSISAALTHAADRVGLWGSLSLGRGSAGLRCTTCANESTRAYVIDGTIGVRLTSKLLMGVESFAWLDVFGGGVDRISRGTHLVARFYPLSQDRLFLHGGVGVASFRIYDNEIGFATRSPSMSLAAGYDVHFANVTLTPSIAAIASTGGRLRSSRTSNAVDDNARLTMFRTSVTFSWFR